MQKLFAAAIGCAVALGLHAETVQVESTAYLTLTQEATEIQLPNGSTVFAGFENVARLIDKDGVEAVQYCHGEGVQEDDGTNTTAGFCAIVWDNGDILWVWFRNSGPGSNGVWGVIGGTGEYAGATGGGTTTPVSQRGDGRSSTSKSTGTITTK